MTYVKVILLRGDATEIGLLSMGWSCDALVGGKNVNRYLKTTPSTYTDVITR